MARRKKRRKGASKQPSSSVTRREFQAGPLLVAQTGSEVSFRVDREHPEYAEFKEAVAEEVESTPARVVEVRERIAELCAPYHAFDVVFAVWMTFGLVRPGTLKPLDTEGSTATPEYVAHVLLDRLTPEPVREPTGETVRRTVNPHELGGLVREILQRLPPWFGYRQSGGKHESDPWLELRTRLYTHRLAIRSFVYEWEEKKTLRTLFEPFELELRHAVGFSVDEAIRLAEGLAPLMLGGFRLSGRAGARVRTERPGIRGSSPGGQASCERLSAGRPGRPVGRAPARRV